VPERIAPRDMIHFRFGLDPQNTRLGLSPLASLLREVFTDDEAAIFSAAILKNMGVPGLIISPKDKSLRPSPSDVDEVKRSFNDVTGTGRGGTKVLGVPTDVAQFGFDPNKLMLGNLRDISEERVCACLGLPAAVVGFGSGMQATKVGATMRELVKMAWVGCLSPMQKTLGKQTTRQLLPDFVSQTRRFRVRFDTSDVSGFQEDDNQIAERVVRITQAGLLRVDRAQAMLGLEVDDTQRIYLRPSNSMPVDENGKPIRDAAPNGAVDGGGEDDDVPPVVAARMSGNGTDPDEEES
jgi:phage portal protein BeeE